MLAMESLTVNSTVVASDTHTSTTIEGEVVILNTERGLYQGLEGTGPRVWELIQEPTTVRTLRDTLVEEYDVTGEECERDLLEFLEKMAGDDLIEIENELE